MSNEGFASVWDAIEDTAAAAENLKLRAALMMALEERIKSQGWTQAEAGQRLADAGLVAVTRVGNQKHYQAHRDTPVFSELHGLVVKTVGIVEPLRAALTSLADRIEAAFVFGSVAKRTDRASSDIDLLVLSADLAYPEVYEALQPAERTLARSVNPTVMTPAQWSDKRARHDSFAARIAEQPKLFVIGSEDALA